MKIRDLLSDITRWTKGASARNLEGESVLATEPCACYCVYGALVHCYGFTGAAAVYARIRERLGMSPVKWNDAPERTFAEVKALVDELDI